MGGVLVHSQLAMRALVFVVGDVRELWPFLPVPAARAQQLVFYTTTPQET